MRDFFISYTKADVEWATWIANALEDAGYTTHFQLWDFRPGMNFILAMDDAAALSRRTIAVLSPNYLAAMFTSAEWSSVLARDPAGKRGTLLPVRIAHCELPPSLAPIAYCDLFGLKEKSARETLLAAVKPGRAKPAGKAPFPGGVTSSTSSSRTGATPKRHAAQLLADVLETTYETFIVQVRLRNQLVEHVRTRLGVSDNLEYEAFFHEYFPRMNSEELRLHGVIRGYTEEALSKYNEQALQIVNDFPVLADSIPSLKKLRHHLRIWLAKYNGVFLETPSMCLVYVGVEEKAPFPSAIDQELRDFLKQPASSRKVPKRNASSKSRGGEGREG